MSIEIHSIDKNTEIEKERKKKPTTLKPSKYLSIGKKERTR
jgi:hypothetical protein